MNIIIKNFSLDHVYEKNGILFNTNNHYSKENRDQPKDYVEKLELTYTSNWINKFHGNNFYKITLDEWDLNWMWKAYQIGKIRRNFSHMFDDELEITCKKYNLPKGEWFIRTEPVSLKYGIHGKGPYSDIKQIIQSMCSTTGTHRCFQKDDKTCNIYLLKWINIDFDKEFRLFIFNNNLTAISIQHIYSPNNWINSLSENKIKDVVMKIKNFFDKNIKKKLKYLNDYTVDLAFIGENEEPYFIEPNCFGKDYAAGSALFHWIIDDETLKDDKFIEFRHTTIHQN